VVNACENLATKSWFSLAEAGFGRAPALQCIKTRTEALSLRLADLPTFFPIPSVAIGWQVGPLHGRSLLQLTRSIYSMTNAKATAASKNAAISAGSNKHGTPRPVASKTAAPRSAAATKTTTKATATVNAPTAIVPARTPAATTGAAPSKTAVKPATAIAGKLPPGFTYPFQRVAMQERLDDSMAVVASLTGQTLETIRDQAFELGFPRQGPGWLDQRAIATLLARYNLTASDWKEASSIAALPDVAMMTVDMVGDKASGYGRFVLWMHFRATQEYASFSAVCDPGHWIAPEHHITTDFKHLRITFPLWYFEIVPKAAAKGRGK
jgi:hypothetical protein